MTFAPASRALATAMAEARSFRDAVGFWPSSFTQSCFSPSCSARRGSSYRGLQPTRRGVGSVVSSMAAAPGSATWSARCGPPAFFVSWFDVVVVVGYIQNAAALAGGKVRRGLIGLSALDALAVQYVFHSTLRFFDFPAPLRCGTYANRGGAQSPAPEAC